MTNNTNPSELVEAAKALRDDLLMRAEKDDDGTLIVNASFGRWRRFCDALDAFSRPTGTQGAVEREGLSAKIEWLLNEKTLAEQQLELQGVVAMHNVSLRMLEAHKRAFDLLPDILAALSSIPNAVEPLGPEQRCPACGVKFQMVHDVDAHLGSLPTTEPNAVGGEVVQATKWVRQGYLAGLAGKPSTPPMHTADVRQGYEAGYDVGRDHRLAHTPAGEPK